MRFHNRRSENVNARTSNPVAGQQTVEMQQQRGFARPVRSDEPDALALSYYTGTIMEVKALDAAMGSICGGGRYDDLTGIFGLPGMSGVGISFGADRIYDVMKELNLFPERSGATTKVLFVNFGPAEEKYCMPLLSRLRDAGISSEIFPDAAKLKKQMDYANRKQIPYVVLIGENEMKEGMFTLKDMVTGVQETVMLDQLMNKLMA